MEGHWVITGRRGLTYDSPVTLRNDACAEVTTGLNLPAIAVVMPKELCSKDAIRPPEGVGGGTKSANPSLQTSSASKRLLGTQCNLRKTASNQKHRHYKHQHRCTHLVAPASSTCPAIKNHRHYKHQHRHTHLVAPASSTCPAKAVVRIQPGASACFLLPPHPVLHAACLRLQIWRPSRRSPVAGTLEAASGLCAPHHLKVPLISRSDQGCGGDLGCAFPYLMVQLT